jgi:sensor histidine kinase kinD
MVKYSNDIEVTIEKVVHNKFYVIFQNKTDDMVELVLSESTINNKAIYDEEEIDTVVAQNTQASFAFAAGSFGNTFSKPNQKVETNSRDLSKKINNIVLAPRERIEMRIGYSLMKAEFPAKVVIKIKKNNKVEYIYINVEKIQEIKKISEKQKDGIKVMIAKLGDKVEADYQKIYNHLLNCNRRNG